MPRRTPTPRWRITLSELLGLVLMAGVLSASVATLLREAGRRQGRQLRVLAAYRLDMSQDERSEALQLAAGARHTTDPAVRWETAHDAAWRFRHADWHARVARALESAANAGGEAPVLASFPEPARAAAPPRPVDPAEAEAALRALALPGWAPSGTPP